MSKSSFDNPVLWAFRDDAERFPHLVSVLARGWSLARTDVLFVLSAFKASNADIAQARAVLARLGNPKRRMEK